MVFGIDDGDGFQDGLEGTRCFGCPLRDLGRDCHRGMPRSLVTRPLSLTRMVNTDCSVSRTTALTSLLPKVTVAYVMGIHAITLPERESEDLLRESLGSRTPLIPEA